MRVLCALDRALERLYLGCGYAAAGFLIAMAGLVLASIVSRLASIYLPGLSEYSGYCMAAASFLAFAYTFRSGGHIRVFVVLLRLRGPYRKVMQVGCLTVAAAVTVYLAFYAVRMTHVSWWLEERSEGDDAVLLWIPQLGMAAGATLLAIAVVHTLVKALLGRADDDPAAAGGSAEA